MEDDMEYCICRSSDVDRFMIGCDNCNEWYHGDCIGITETDASKIVKFYCQICMDKDKSLKIEYEKKEKKKEKRTDAGLDICFAPPLKKKKASHHKTKKPPDESPSSPRRGGGCGQCIGCFRTEDCGKCDNCLTSAKGGSKIQCKQRRCVQQSLSTAKDHRPASIDRSGRSTSTHHEPEALTKHKKRKTTDQDSAAAFAVSRTRRTKKQYGQFLKEAGLTTEEDEEEDLKQCMGPQCVNAARIKSKYCSDACGLKLATLRILDLLPERYAAYHSDGGPVADQHARSRLERIGHDRIKAKEALEALDAQEKGLKEWLEMAAREKASEDADSAESESEDADVSMSCITCGHEVNVRVAVRHMSRCFNKFESQSTYESAQKTSENIYNLFCDEYNPKAGTYCKRLKVICPEHAKDPKISDDEICGCPLARDGEPSDLSKMCRTRKRKCNRHYRWDRIKFALIAMNRLNQLLKLDELWEEEVRTTEAMQCRGDVMGLLLHDTTVY